MSAEFGQHRVIDFPDGGDEKPGQVELPGQAEFGGNAQGEAYGFGHGGMDLVFAGDPHGGGDDLFLSGIAVKVVELVPHHHEVLVFGIKLPLFHEDGFQELGWGSFPEADFFVAEEVE